MAGERSTGRRSLKEFHSFPFAV